MGLEDGGGDLLAPVGGQAVEHHAVRLCRLQKGAGELEARKIPQAALALGGPGGGGVPDGRHHRVGVPDTLGGVFQQTEGTAIPVGKHQHIRCRAVARRTDAGYLHPRQKAAHDQTVCHVAAVAHKAELQPCQRAPALPNGHQVSQHLTGVGVVGKAVDHRNAGKLRQFLQVPLHQFQEH